MRRVKDWYQLGSAKSIVSNISAIEAREVSPEESELVDGAQWQRKVKFADEVGTASEGLQ